MPEIAGLTSALRAVSVTAGVERDMIVATRTTLVLARAQFAMTTTTQQPDHLGPPIIHPRRQTVTEVGTPPVTTQRGIHTVGSLSLGFGFRFRFRFGFGFQGSVTWGVKLCGQALMNLANSSPAVGCDG
jgi:hypothetical protein